MKSPFQSWLCRTFGLGLLSGLGLCPGWSAESAFFSHPQMQEVDLDGFKVWLGKPVQVTAQRAWSSGGNGADGNELGWAFAHPIPSLNRFPGGNLLLTYSMSPDSQSIPEFVSAFQLSSDGGGHWSRRYNVIMLHNPMTFIPGADDSLLGISSEVMPQSQGEPRNFVAPTYRFENGGERMTFFPDGMRVVDWPDPVETNPSAAPEEDWHVGLAIYGSGVQLGGRFLATGMTFKRRADGRRMFRNLLVATEDGGKTWRYFSTIADYDPALGAAEGYEGPNEACLIRLQSGELMTVFRVGNGSPKWRLRRTFSHDGGKSWSQPEVLPAYSVKPVLVQLANSAVAVTTGRPGIDLWLADAPHSQHWQRVDLLQHHNAWAPDATYRIASGPTENGVHWNARSTTTSYTSIVQVAPNRLLIAYDRCEPDRSPAGPTDLSRVFFMPVEICRRNPPK